jgi:hypothetical protein
MNVSGTWLDRVLLRILPLRVTCVVFLEYRGIGLSILPVPFVRIWFSDSMVSIILLRISSHHWVSGATTQ